MFFFLSGNVNNCHCLALAVNQLAGAMFHIHGPGDVHDRLQEFLAVSFFFNKILFKHVVER